MYGEIVVYCESPLRRHKTRKLVAAMRRTKAKGGSFFRNLIYKSLVPLRLLLFPSSRKSRLFYLFLGSSESEVDGRAEGRTDGEKETERGTTASLRRSSSSAAARGDIFHKRERERAASKRKAMCASSAFLFLLALFHLAKV